MNIPNLDVLNSTGPGQIGWAAPELKGSVFGYFLWQGLNGAADVEAVGKPRQGGLAPGTRHYLKAYVGQWVTENRADVQEPMLLPADADFPIVFRHSSQPTTVPPPGEADPRWKQIAALWEKHAELRRKDPVSLSAGGLGGVPAETAAAGTTGGGGSGLRGRNSTRPGNRRNRWPRRSIETRLGSTW